MNNGFVYLFRHIAMLKITPPHLRNYLLNKCIGKVAPTAEIKNEVYLGGQRFSIGEHVFINKFCRLFSGCADESAIILEDNVVLAMGVTLTTHTHQISYCKRRAPRQTLLKPITIKEGCWLGANVTVLPGVTIGKGTVVGAGSVVIKDLEPNSVYVGNPAHKVKDLE